MVKFRTYPASAHGNQSGMDKARVMVVCFAAGVYLVGLASPYWASAELVRGQLDGSNVTYTYHEGLWVVCVSAVMSTVTAGGCAMFDTQGETGFPVLMHVQRALLCLGAAGLVVICIYLLVVSCSHHTQASSGRVIEFLTVFSGLLGLAGCTIYVPVRAPSLSVWSNRLHWSKGWAFDLTLLGSCLSALAGPLLSKNTRQQRKV